MINRSRKLMAGAALLALGTAAAAAIPSEAEARWRHRGAYVAGGIIGGLALGAILSRPAYGYPAYGYGYYGSPAPAYTYGPSYYGGHCYWARQRVQVDPWTYQIRRVRVCN